jgi:hypothetical protein
MGGFKNFIEKGLIQEETTPNVLSTLKYLQSFMDDEEIDGDNFKGMKKDTIGFIEIAKHYGFKYHKWMDVMATSKNNEEYQDKNTHE